MSLVQSLGVLISVLRDHTLHLILYITIEIPDRTESTSSHALCFGVIFVQLRWQVNKRDTMLVCCTMFHVCFVCLSQKLYLIFGIIGVHHIVSNIMQQNKDTMSTNSYRTKDTMCKTNQRYHMQKSQRILLGATDIAQSVRQLPLPPLK